MLKEYELSDLGSWRKIRTEVKLLHELSHAHIAELQAVFREPDATIPTAYLQLAYYEGGDLAQWLEAQQPDMARRRTILNQVALALQHMHAHGAAHGDVKQENVLISQQVTHHVHATGLFPAVLTISARVFLVYRAPLILPISS